MTWEDALTQWNNVARSRYTQRINTVAVRLFFNWYGGALQHVAVDILEAYALYLQDRTTAYPKLGKRLTISTMNKYAECLKLFLIFCRKKGWLELSREEIEESLPKWHATTVRPHEILTQEEINQLMEAAASPRDQIILALGLYAGLRNMEICSLLCGHVGCDHEGAFIQVVAGKGHKNAYVPIHDDLYTFLVNFIGERGPDAPLVLMTIGGTLAMIHRLARRVGIQKNITIHSLRHTYAFQLLQDGTPLDKIQELLRHTDLRVTTRYLKHVSRRDLARYAPGFHGALPTGDRRKA